jgi:hypothetical protein
MELFIYIALSVWIVGIISNVAIQYWVAKSMHDHFND